MSDTIFINNLSRKIDNPARITYCDSFACRLRGLMFRSELAKDEGLLLVESKDSRIDTSIHMLFVPFDLTVVWINSEFSVVDKIIAKSWHAAYFPKASAAYTLEIHPDRWNDYQIGDKVEFQKY